MVVAGEGRTDGRGAVAGDDAGAGSSACDEILTEELLEQLLSSASPEAYFEGPGHPVEGRDLVAYLAHLLERSGLRRARVIRESGVNATFGYQVFQGTRRPGRDTALALALSLGASLRETQRLLRLSGNAELWVKDRRDAIIAFCLDRGLGRAATDDKLYELGEETLVG